MILSLVTLTICAILIILNLLISKKKMWEKEKISPFECGFEPKTSSRLPFSLRFYLIALIFLIFDVEIALILPMPTLMAANKNLFIINLTLIFIIILILGLFHEWAQGALNWDN